MTKRSSTFERKEVHLRRENPGYAYDDNNGVIGFTVWLLGNDQQQLLYQPRRQQMVPSRLQAP